MAAKKAPKGKKLKAKKLSLTTVYSFSNGETHVRGRVETRGRNEVLTRQDVRTLLQARRRLILQQKDSQKPKRVRYSDIIEKAALEKGC